MIECRGVLLDTSFFIRLLDEESPLFVNANNYYRYFVQQDIPMYISTISIAEYCTGGQMDELPLKDLRIIPFNIQHSLTSGALAKSIFLEKDKLQIKERNIIPNDTKLFSQACVEVDISHYLSSDKKSEKIYETLKSKGLVYFDFISLDTPCGETFGILDL